VVVSTWFSTRTGLALGVTTTGASVGTIYLALLSTALIDAFGWRAAFQVLAGVTVCGIGAVSFVFRVPGGFGAAVTIRKAIRKHCLRGGGSGDEAAQRESEMTSVKPRAPLEAAALSSSSYSLNRAEPSRHLSGSGSSRQAAMATLLLRPASLKGTLQVQSAARISLRALFFFKF